MSARRQELQAKLVDYYRSCGFKPRVAEDGTVRAAGLGGVTWIGLPILAEDLGGLPQRLHELSAERMPTGQLCPLELLPEAGCEDEVRAVLRETRIADRRYVEVYSLAA
ncbi:MAG: hypothetical protein WD067_04940 [Gaiellaceae bacterium]